MLERLIRYRRDLHKIPEIGFDLPETLAYVTSVLSKLPCEIVPAGKAGLCAYFDAGKPGTLAFRSDMDALPISEKNVCGYASAHPGKMHACGHDGHMAILLVFAEEAAKNLAALPHNLLLVFQAAEETTGGAKEICESGIFEKYRAKKIFGLHLWPEFPQGAVICRKNEFMAKTCNLCIEIYGRSSHAARSERGIDALLIGTRFVRAAYEMEQEIPPAVFRLLKFGIFESGTAVNVISGKTTLRGSMRCFQDEIFRFMSDRLDAIADGLQKEFGCKIEITRLEGYPAVINKPALFDEVKRAMCDGEKPLPFIEPEAPTMAGEDFSFYQRQMPGLFFHLGCGAGAPLHSDTFDPDEAALAAGVKAFTRLLYGIR
ncbi:MAG: amidohydrolase [Clostridiales Family XIII bacterium]|jgi:hippurate hydrolase|nr:amidohydrolase [Clostridiales Family XIII bacterium]